MKLNHLNLPVTDVAAAHSFLQTYFGMQPMGRSSTKMAGLIDASGLILVLMHVDNIADDAYPPGFHLGFIQETVTQVDAIYQSLKDDGFDVPAPRRMHGGWAFYLQAPGGFTIEVSC